jgi:hypothetical protein
MYFVQAIFLALYVAISIISAPNLVFLVIISKY